MKKNKGKEQRWWLEQKEKEKVEVIPPAFPIKLEIQESRRNSATQETDAVR